MKALLWARSRLWVFILRALTLRRYGVQWALSFVGKKNISQLWSVVGSNFGLISKTSEGR